MLHWLTYTKIPKVNSTDYACEKFKSSNFNFKQGDFIVIGSKPFYGKTSLLYDMLVKRLHQQKVCLLLDFSVNQDVAISKVVCRYSELDYDKLVKNTLSSKDVELFMKNQKKLIESKLLIFPKKVNYKIIDSLSTYIDDFCSEQKQNIDYLFLDFLQLFISTQNDNRYSDVSVIAKALKHLSITHGLVTVATSTFNRKFEERENKTPKITDLRDSGAIEDCADYILLLDEYSSSSSIVKKELHVYSNHSNVPTVLEYKYVVDKKIFI